MPRNLLSMRTGRLTAAQFDHLSEIPPEDKWLADIGSRFNKTRIQNRCGGIR